MAALPAGLIGPTTRVVGFAVTLAGLSIYAFVCYAQRLRAPPAADPQGVKLALPFLADVLGGAGGEEGTEGAECHCIVLPGPCASSPPSSRRCQRRGAEG